MVSFENKDNRRPYLDITLLAFRTRPGLLVHTLVPLLLAANTGFRLMGRSASSVVWFLGSGRHYGELAPEPGDEKLRTLTNVMKRDRAGDERDREEATRVCGTLFGGKLDAPRSRRMHGPAACDETSESRRNTRILWSNTTSHRGSYDPRWVYHRICIRIRCYYFCNV